MRLGILGATGWLGGALAARLVAGGWPEARLVLANRSGPRGFPLAEWTDAAAVARADVVVVAVRPEDFPTPGFAPDGLVISFATVWTLDKLRALAPRARIVRAMPNSGAPQGASYTPWVGDVGPGDAELVMKLLSAMGEVVRLTSEDQLDYMAALPGSGMAYPALMAQAMLTHARAFGLPEAVAQRAVQAVVVQAASGLLGRMGDLDAVLDLYRGYRGVTAAGIAAAAPGMAQAMSAALEAAHAKAVDLGR
ncbi:NAD(P)-binding domain-containing protein [Rhodobacter sp. KR11]|uniref:pyrroline-5-carboxylate reductase family protein n=1 Tax=Rhodobacter sp. KR11 TaxID=2974588 RepID=UPI0022214D15|nr:pyrroline-5-carboxylate reductase dimerization domain-containing protein [Rhodobacter sp. KR11]MCW1920616.1 NAD(P)-binding domain-containing protein [Rhodobacter sp. KR11]